MKLAFSNIAWTPHDSAEIFNLLRNNNITGIEVAPTKVWANWEGANYKSAVEYRRKLADEGFEIPAFQAILFNKPEAKLFDEQGEKNLLEHLQLVAELAEGCGAKSIVFGAPKQRDIGSLSHEEAVEHSIGIFRKIGQMFAEHGAKFCIEPNPKRYSCNFINNIEQANELVRKVGHEGFKLHLDAAGMFLEGDDITKKWNEVSDIVCHFHISEPDLGGFETPQISHKKNMRTLSENGYTGWFSVEMREPEVPLKNSNIWNILK
jgi:D-psicose/D-tagatose/L-ribulose 3-epimerase